MADAGKVPSFPQRPPRLDSRGVNVRPARGTCCAWSAWGNRALALALAALMLSCAGSFSLGRGGPGGAGVQHTVRPGETLYRIALFYKVPVKRIAAANGLGNPNRLAAGARLRIPGALQGKRPRGPLLPPPDVLREMRRGGRSSGAGLKFAWPLRGRLSSRYGMRWGRMHEGIDIAAPSGTRVRCVESGRVIHSGRLGGYGNVVIVRHKGGFSSVYSHNRKNRVRKGQRVKRGETIAEVGATGRATGPHLHFELRRSDRPVDPLRYLP